MVHIIVCEPLGGICLCREKPLKKDQLSCIFNLARDEENMVSNYLELTAPNFNWTIHLSWYLNHFKGDYPVSLLVSSFDF